MYGYYFDKNQWDSIADLFTEDATYEIGQRGVYKGKKRIREALNLIGPAGRAARPAERRAATPADHPRVEGRPVGEGALAEPWR